MYLSNLNPHERDSHISFEEGPHIYTIDGSSDFMSVTTWNHSHFGHFDADKIIDKMMGRNWGPGNKYWGMSKKEIKKMWQDNGTRASVAGTKMHCDIELYYNDAEVEVEDCAEWSYFEKFEEEVGQYKEPYRTEWMVWDAGLKFAGSIDMVYKNGDGTLDIYDWKRSKGIKMTNKWQSSTTPCIQHLPDCNYYHYCLQLNTYKALLEKNYGATIKDMYLVCLHPINDGYQLIKVLDLQKEVKALFDLRRKMLRKELKK